ncbi:FBA_3 domain-containing protein [Psidium guajava]|nr:FBA_3 domain-containing protein [Psidium guajava]
MFKSPEIKRCKVKAVGDGLLCLRHEGFKPQKDIWYIANPITKQVLKLPKPPTECQCPYGCAYGIGLDRSSATPKVVRVFFPSYESCFSYTLGAEVYDLRERCWRRPRTSRVSVSIFPPRVGEGAICAKGGIHWFKDTDLAGQGLDPKIVSFDLAKEEFSLLRPPKFKNPGNDTGLFEVRGSLAIANHSLARRMEVWVSESTSSKWTKRYKIEFAAFPDNFKGYVTPRRVRCVGEIDGEMVLVNSWGMHCFSFYNPKQRRSSRGFDFEHVPHVRLSHIFAFTPTLISLNL